MAIPDELKRLAEKAGILTSYFDVNGCEIEADPDALRKILDNIGEMTAPQDTQIQTDWIVRFPRHRELDRSWGLFIPLYALHSEKSWGVGDFSDLERLADWAASMGASFIGTLPLNALLLDGENRSYSPYQPASRLFWNELYIDIPALPEYEECEHAKLAASSPGFQSKVSKLNGQTLVDWNAVNDLKRPVLEILARYVSSGERWNSELVEFLDKHPEIRNYAEFRAQRNPDNHETAVLYHRYVQWALHRQLTLLKEKTDAAGIGFYFDLPLGSHPDGYDINRYSDQFITDLSTGAPPDPFFDAGQNWGFPPLHPDCLNRTGGDYLREVMRTQMQFARLLRIDHVMSMHRLYVVPDGFSARDGTYIRYPSATLYNLAATEAIKAGCEVIGEDLGTVPDEVRQEMRRYGMSRMWVLPFETSEHGINDIPLDALALTGTHDIPPFARYWNDLDRNQKKVILDFLGQAGFKLPDDSCQNALNAVLRWLADSQARFLMVNLEDLWLETEPQNIPGTVTEYPNWRRKTRLTLEQLEANPEISGLLASINRLRKGL